MVDDGYGVFYRINDHQMVYAITAWKNSSVTDVKKYSSLLEESFDDIREILQSAEQHRCN